MYKRHTVGKNSSYCITMRYDGYDSDSAVATTSRRRRRRRREICRSFTCISPWFIFWRWFNGGKSTVSRNRFAERNWGKEKMEMDFDVKMKSGVLSSSSRKDFSEISKEASFNLGIGFGLIYLIRKEINKMVELRKRIELLLQNFHAEIENQDKVAHFVPSRTSISSSVREMLYAEEHRSGQHLSCHDVKRPDIGFGSNRFSREKSLRMDQLEAELEAEFDRLQSQMDGEFSLKYSQQQFQEVNAEESAPGMSLNMCFEEEVINEPHELSNNKSYGVCPRDLESKLHQVLEARQQEKINELESALEYAMQQLGEKERELSCWQDAARLISQHLRFVPAC